jgi:hypothetical protein
MKLAGGERQHFGGLLPNVKIESPELESIRAIFEQADLFAEGRESSTNNSRKLLRPQPLKGRAV